MSEYTQSYFVSRLEAEVADLTAKLAAAEAMRDEAVRARNQDRWYVGDEPILKAELERYREALEEIITTGFGREYMKDTARQALHPASVELVACDCGAMGDVRQDVQTRPHAEWCAATPAEPGQALQEQSGE